MTTERRLTLTTNAQFVATFRSMDPKWPAMILRYSAVVSSGCCTIVLATTAAAIVYGTSQATRVTTQIDRRTNGCKLIHKTMYIQRIPTKTHAGGRQHTTLRTVALLTKWMLQSDKYEGRGSLRETAVLSTADAIVAAVVVTAATYSPEERKFQLVAATMLCRCWRCWCWL